MPRSADNAARRRDERLARTRRVSLWVAGGAAAASLGLGTAFAHDLPGHHAPGPGTQPVAPANGAAPTAQPNGTQASPEPGGSGANQTPPAQRPGRGAATGPSPAPTQVSQPQQPPATTPAPAQTVSGGS